MIAADTNVLLRYVLRDDQGQAERARSLIDKATRVLITDVVLAETVNVTGIREIPAPYPSAPRRRIAPYPQLPHTHRHAEKHEPR